MDKDLDGDSGDPGYRLGSASRYASWLQSFQLQIVDINT